MFSTDETRSGPIVPINIYKSLCHVNQMHSNDSSRQIQSVATAFEILSFVQRQGSVTLQNVSDHFDIAKSTAHNHLSTLHAMGYVSSEGNAYRLGLRLLTHGMAAREAIQSKEMIRDVLATVASSIDFPVWWIVEDHGRGIFVEKMGDADESYGRVGKRSYLHTHAPGKAILAELSEKQVQNIIDIHGLPVHTAQTITDPDELYGELKSIRKQGYARSSDEAALGIESLGVAFSGEYNRVHAIGVFGYSHGFGEKQHSTAIVDELVRAKQELTEKRS